MPFKSKAQQRFMFATDPEMAHRWAEHTVDIKKLPERVGDQGRKQPEKSKMALDQNEQAERPTDADRVMSSIPLVGALHSGFTGPEGYRLQRTLHNIAGGLGGELLGHGASALTGIPHLGLAGNVGGSYAALKHYDDQHFPEQKAASNQVEAPTDEDRMWSSIPGLGAVHSALTSPKGHSTNRTLFNIMAGQTGGTIGHMVGGNLGAIAGNTLGSYAMLSHYDKKHFPQDQQAKQAGDMQDAKKKSRRKMPGVKDEFPGSFNGSVEGPASGSAPVNIALKKLPGTSKSAAFMGGVLGAVKMVPGVGTVLGGAQGALQGYANGEGVKGMLGRGALGAAAGTASIGGPITSAIAGTGLAAGANMIGDKLFSRPQPPQAPSMLPGR